MYKNTTRWHRFERHYGQIRVIDEYLYALGRIHIIKSIDYVLTTTKDKFRAMKRR